MRKAVALFFVMALGAFPVRAAEPVRIVAFGDSLTMGYRLKAGESFAEQLEAELRRRGEPVRVINAGVAGDTTRTAARRLDRVMAGEPDGVILELGANDALQERDPRDVEADLGRILALFQKEKIPVLLAGFRAPPAAPSAYRKAFSAMYKRLARRYPVIFHPFFMQGILNKGGEPEAAYLLSDGVHPTASGVGIIVNNLMGAVEKLVEEARTRKIMRREAR